MVELLEKLKYDYMSIFLHPIIVYIIIVLMVSVACLVDYYSGIRKAKDRGEKLLSHGFRKSINKAIIYYCFLLFSLMFDFIIILIMHAWNINMKLNLPYMSMIFGLIVLRIEYKSVKEKASDKIKNQIPNIDILEILKQPDAVSKLKEAIKQLEQTENNKDNGDEKTN